MYPTRKTHITLQQQRGAAFIVMLVILIMGVAAFLVSSLNSSAVQIARDKITTDALAQAKAALIGRSASSATFPGQLPCPEDTTLIGGSTEGQALPTCTLPAIGRLPWRTLGLGDLRDGNGDKLWYVISAGFRTAPINSNTPALLTVDGNPNSAVAIIFSAGSPINGQSRPVPTSSSPPVVSQYLDLTNNTGSNAFISTGPTTTFNDRLLLVTHNDLFNAVERRVAAEIRGVDDPPTSGLRDFYYKKANHYYPCAANAGSTGNPVTSPSCLTAGLVPYASLSFTTATYNWLNNNNWFSLISYAVAPNFQLGTSYSQQCGTGGSGCLTVNNYINAQAQVTTVGGFSAIVCTTNLLVTTCPYP